MTGVKWLAGLGAVLLGVGLYMGLFVSYVHDGQVTVECGNAWSPSRDAEKKDEYMNSMSRALAEGGPSVTWDFAGRCEDALGSRGGWGAALAGLGSLTLLGSGFLLATRREGEQQSAGPATS